MNLESSAKRIVTLLNNSKLFSIGKKAYHGKIATLFFDNSKVEDEEVKNMLDEIDTLVKGLIALGVLAITSETIRKTSTKIIGIMKAFGEAAAETQAMGITKLNLYNDHIDFEGFCLNYDKKVPDTKTNMYFTTAVPDHTSVKIDECIELFYSEENERMLKTLGRTFENAEISYIDAKDAAESIISDLISQAKNNNYRLEEAALSEVKLSDQWIKTFQECVPIYMKNHLLQSLIWRITDNVIITEMLRVFEAGFIVPELQLFAINVGETEIPYHISLFPLNADVKKICNYFLWYFKKIDMEVRFSDEIELIKEKGEIVINKYKEDLLAQVEQNVKEKRKNAVKEEIEMLKQSWGEAIDQ